MTSERVGKMASGPQRVLRCSGCAVADTASRTFAQSSSISGLFVSIDAGKRLGARIFSCCMMIDSKLQL